MKTRKRHSLPVFGLFALLLILSGCAPGSGSGKGSPSPKSNVQVDCNVALQTSSPKDTVVSSMRVRSSCALTEDEFLETYGLAF